jgi:hypothetical protein
VKGAQGEASGTDESARLPLPQLRPERPREQAWQLQRVSLVEESALSCKCPVCGLIHSTISLGNSGWGYHVRLPSVRHRTSSPCSRRTGFDRSRRKAAAAEGPERGSGAMASTRRTRGVHMMLVRGYPPRIGSMIRAARLASTLISHQTIVLSIAYNGPDHRFPRQRAHRSFQAVS